MTRPSLQTAAVGRYGEWWCSTPLRKRCASAMLAMLGSISILMRFPAFREKRYSSGTIGEEEPGVGKAESEEIPISERFRLGITASAPRVSGNEGSGHLRWSEHTPRGHRVWAPHIPVQLMLVCWTLTFSSRVRVALLNVQHLEGDRHNGLELPWFRILGEKLCRRDLLSTLNAAHL